jgi:hypothetical protein
MRITNAKTVSEPRGEVMEESAVAGNLDVLENGRGLFADEWLGWPRTENDDRVLLG